MAKGLNAQHTAYAQARAAGMDPKSAGAHAGYAHGGLAQQVSRLEARADIKAAIAKFKKEPPQSVEDPDTKGAEKWAMKDHYATPLDLFRDVWNNPQAPNSVRYQAAKDAAPYMHARKEGGKKDDAEQRAKDAAAGTGRSSGKFKTPQAPGRARPN